MYEVQESTLLCHSLVSKGYIAMKDVVPQKLGLMDIGAAVVCIPSHVCVAIEIGPAEK